jgi:hypothetical protein
MAMSSEKEPVFRRWRAASYRDTVLTCLPYQNAASWRICVTENGGRQIQVCDGAVGPTDVKQRRLKFLNRLTSPCSGSQETRCEPDAVKRCNKNVHAGPRNKPPWQLFDSLTPASPAYFLNFAAHAFLFIGKTRPRTILTVNISAPIVSAARPAH